MPIAPGAPLPPATVLDAQAAPGVPVDLRGLAARGPALLLVYKADCPASPLAAAVLPRFAAIEGLALATVSQDDAADARRFSTLHGHAGAVRALVDPEPWPASDALGVRATPTWFLLAPGGAVDAVREGWSRDDANALAARAAALAGVPAPVVARADDPGPPFRPG